MFTNSGALKLEKDVQFEVGGMDLTPYLSGPLHSDDSRPIFDMYGCVCHFGCVYGGHYTAFARHLGTDQWNHFNDNSIEESKIPGEAPGDNSSAYILFYQRAGKPLTFRNSGNLARAEFRTPWAFLCFFFFAKCRPSNLATYWAAFG